MWIHILKYRFPEILTKEEKEDAAYNPPAKDFPVWFRKAVLEGKYVPLPLAHNREKYKKRKPALGLDSVHVLRIREQVKPKNSYGPARRYIYNKLKDAMLLHLISTNGARTISQLCDILADEIQNGPNPIPKWYRFAPWLEHHRNVGYKRCANVKCFRTEHPLDEEPFPRCSGCLVAAYCSEKCQKANWDRHRYLCQAAETMRSMALHRSISRAMLFHKSTKPFYVTTRGKSNHDFAGYPPYGDHETEEQSNQPPAPAASAADKPAPARSSDRDAARGEDSDVFRDLPFTGVAAQFVAENAADLSASELDLLRSKLLRQAMANPDLMRQVMHMFDIDLPADWNLKHQVLTQLAMNYPPTHGPEDDDLGHHHGHTHSHGGIPCHGHSHAHAMNGPHGAGGNSQAQDRSIVYDVGEELFYEHLDNLNFRRHELEEKIMSLEDERDKLTGRGNKHRRQRITRKIAKIEKEIAIVDDELDQIQGRQMMVDPFAFVQGPKT